MSWSKSTRSNVLHADTELQHAGGKILDQGLSPSLSETELAIQSELRKARGMLV